MWQSSQVNRSSDEKNVETTAVTYSYTKKLNNRYSSTLALLVLYFVGISDPASFAITGVASQNTEHGGATQTSRAFARWRCETNKTRKPRRSISNGKIWWYKHHCYATVSPLSLGAGRAYTVQDILPKIGKNGTVATKLDMAMVMTGLGGYRRKVRLAWTI